MPTCSRCGREVTDGAQFCMHCGTELSDASVKTQQMDGGSRAATRSQTSLLDALRRATLGDYEIIGELGRGGMATVYLAHDIALDRKVAIKVISPTLLMMAEGMAERFMREARTAAALSHPNIIPIYAVKEIGDVLYFVMKYVSGRTLESVIREVGPFPMPMVVTILNQVGSALGYAHRHGVIHRDIKPGNVMLDEEGWAVVTDFGIAKVTQADALTMTGGTVGTPSYMSPEQCAGAELTGAADQYSLGVVAYEMITGRQPFEGESAMAVMYEHCNSPPPPVTEHRHDCPSGVAKAVLRMLEKAPGDRWPSVEDAVAAMGSVSATESVMIRSQLLTLARTGEAHALLEKFRTPRSPVPQSRSVPQVAGEDATPAHVTPSEAPTVSVAKSRLRAWWWAIPLAAAAGVAGFFLRPGPSEPSPGPRPVAGVPAATPTPMVAMVEVTPRAAALAVGERLQLSAVPRDVGGAVVDDAPTEWTSGSPGTAAVSAAGIVSAVRPGTARITAESGGQAAQMTITVSAATPVPPPSPQPARPLAAPGVATVAVSPASGTIYPGDSIDLQAVPRGSDGAPLANRPVRWSSSDPSVVAVSSAGLARGVALGTARISATSQERSGFATITVAEVLVASVRVAPQEAMVRPGEMLPLRVTVIDARGNQRGDRAVTWRSSDPALASVGDDGVVTARVRGDVTITAAVGGVSGRATLHVEPAPAIAERSPDPRNAVARVIEGYARGIESGDIDALRRAYPGMTNSQEQAWREFFSGVSDLRVDLEVTSLTTSADTAYVEVTGLYEYRTARREQQTVRFTATLVHKGSGWNLTAVR